MKPEKAVLGWMTKFRELIKEYPDNTEQVVIDFEKYGNMKEEEVTESLKVR